MSNTYHFDCLCNCADHTIRLTLSKDPEYPEIYLEVQLHQWRSWHRRAWLGIKYIFGYESKYGHWDCWTLKEEDVVRLRTMLYEFTEINMRDK